MPNYRLLNNINYTSDLKKLNVEIITTGGTFKKIQDMKYKCKEISSYTGLPEMLEGRVKTLNPKIHAGILNIRKTVYFN